MNQHADKVPPSVGVDVGGIETLLRRNLPDVFGEGDPARRKAAIRSRRLASGRSHQRKARGSGPHGAGADNRGSPRAFASMAREGADGVFVMASSFTRSNAAILAELALKHQLPNMFGTRENVEAGGFMSYARRRLHR